MNPWIGAGDAASPYPPVGSWHPLTIPEMAKYGATHRAVIKYSDLPAGIAANTAQTLNILPITVNQLVECITCLLVTPFANSADATQNTTGVTVGDPASANRFITTTELNLNGAYVSAVNGAKATARLYTAAVIAADAVNANWDAATITFAAGGAGKSLSNLTQGELHVLFKVLDPATP